MKMVLAIRIASQVIDELESRVNTFTEYAEKTTAGKTDQEADEERQKWTERANELRTHIEAIETLLERLVK
jgi:hypothetical protein